MSIRLLRTGGSVGRIVETPHCSLHLEKLVNGGLNRWCPNLACGFLCVLCGISLRTLRLPSGSRSTLKVENLEPPKVRDRKGRKETERTSVIVQYFRASGVVRLKSSLKTVRTLEPKRRRLMKPPSNARKRSIIVRLISNILLSFIVTSGAFAERRGETVRNHTA